MSQPIAEVDVTAVPAELPEGLAILDVREDDEWRAGHIDGAWHVPLAQLPQRLGDLPAADQVVVVCKAGGARRRPRRSSRLRATTR